MSAGEEDEDNVFDFFEDEEEVENDELLPEQQDPSAAQNGDPNNLSEH